VSGNNRKTLRLPDNKLYSNNNSFFITICVQDKKCILGDFVGEKLVSPIPSQVAPQGRVSSPLGGLSRQRHGELSPHPGELKFAPTGVGCIVEDVWINLPCIFDNIFIEDYVVMPNHFHGIITFYDTPISKSTRKATDLSKIIKYFKAKSTLKIKAAVGEKLVSPIPSQVAPQGGVSSPLGGLSPHPGELKFAPTQNYNNDLDYLIYNYSTIWQKSYYDHIIRNEKDLNRVREYIFNNPLNWRKDPFRPSGELKFAPTTCAFPLNNLLNCHTK
jgi:REP element-mobilizing transposase RayT